MKPDPMNNLLSAESAQEQWRAIIQMLKDAVRERLKTPAGRESLRRDIAGLQRVKTAMVKFEDEQKPPNDLA